MRNRRSLTPRLETIEARNLLTTVVPFVGPMPAVAVSPFVAPITGSVAGHYAETTAGATTTVTLTASGTLTPLGAVTLAGTVTSSDDGASGTITLTGASGKVTLSLTPYITGPVRPASDPGSAVPDAYVYTVVSATGSYSGISGRGEVTLGLGAGSSGSDTITFASIPRIQPL